MKTPLLVVAALFSSGCAGTGELVKSPSSPSAWKTYWLEQHRAELKPVAPAEPRAVGGGRTVLLVPGMTIGQEMFEPMAERLRRDGFRPVLYEDATLLTTGVVPAARRLAMRVEELLAQTGEDRLDVVAECVGGVTARYYLQMLGGDRRVAHLVTFVSPHHGSWPAVVAGNFTRWPAFDDIRRGSALLQSVDARPLSGQVAFTSIYSCADGYLYPKDTAKVEGAVNVELCEGALGHFDGFWDPGVYQHVVAGLQRQPAALVSR